MKKYFLIPILSGLLLTVSCSDQLERFPVDQLVEETAFQTVADLEAGLRGAIVGLNLDNMVAFNAIFTDNCQLGVDNGGQQLNLLNQILNADGGDQGSWANRYNVLNRINRVLAAAENVTPGVGEGADYNNVVGMLRALRGYLHSELLLYYGLNFEDPSALGVVIQNFVSTDGFSERNTTGEVLAAIEDDFTAATGLITSTDKSFPTDDMITFQRARNALYSGNYSAAVTFANTIIGKYPLAAPADYTAMFGGDANDSEVVWRYDNVQGANNSVAGNFIFTGTGGNFIELSNGLFDALAADGGVRFTVNVAADGTNGSDFTAGQYGIFKYPPNGDTQYINDYKLMRVSEMYLIRAEAYARQSQFGPAAADITTLRTIRGSVIATPAYANLAQAIADIKAERRVELAFEGHRYLDIKRYRNILNVGIERDPRDCPGGIPCSVPNTSEKFIFPIPIAEINANPDITQAPGY